MNPDKIRLLDKLVTLCSWSSECADVLERLADEPDKFFNTMTLIEHWVGKSEEDSPSREALDALAEDDPQKMYRLAVDSAPLFKLMRSEPFFGNSTARELAAFAQFADLRPAPPGKATFNTRDGAFMRVLDMAEKNVPATPEQLLTEDFTKLCLFEREYPEVFECLLQLAGDWTWGRRLREIESEVEGVSKAPETDDEDEDAAARLRRLLQEAVPTAEAAADAAAAAATDGTPAVATPSDATAADAAPAAAAPAVTTPAAPTVRDEFLAPPRFSSMLRQELTAFNSVLEQLSSAESLLAGDLFANVSGRAKYSRVAQQAFRLLAEEDRDSLVGALDLRRKVADYFLELRKFAKVDALRHMWPALYEQLQLNDPSLLRTLERLAIDRAAPADADPSYKPYLQDRRLMDFLRLRPPFLHIARDDVQKHSEASQAISAASQAAAAAAQAVASAQKPQGAAAVTLQPQAAEQPRPSYENLTVYIRPNPSGKPDHYDIALKGSSFTVRDVVKVPAQLINHLATRPFGYFRETSEAQRGEGSLSDDQVVQLIAAETQRSGDHAAQLIAVGTHLFEWFFGKPPILEPFMSVLQGEKNTRIVFQLEGPELMALPWECLYVPQLQIFPALYMKFSLIRHLPRTASLASPTLTPPLRILAVMTNPTDAPLMMLGQEIDVLRQTLAGPENQGQVIFDVLENATVSKLQRKLRAFRPHLFHFLGHGSYDQNGQKGKLIFEDEEGKSELVETERVAALLLSSNISLAVLNACQTGSAADRKLLSGVAAFLVQNGIPAAVATLREVQDQAALLFTREFYSSFVDGYPLEAAVTEARKALFFEHWDWPVYTIFSATTQLENFRLLTGANQRLA